MSIQTPQIQMLQDQQEQPIYIRNYWAILRRRGWLVFLSIALMVSLAVLYLIRTPKEYEATAVVMTATTGGGGEKGELAIISALLGGSSQDLATEIEIIKGRDLVGRAIEELNLAEKEETSELDWRRIVSGLQKRLKVEKKGGTNLIEITAASDIPQEAKDVANRLAVLYIELSENSKQEVWDNLANHLKVELDRVQKALSESRRRLYNGAKQDGVMTAFSSLLSGGRYAVPDEVPQAVVSLKTSIMSMEIQLESLKVRLPDTNPEVIKLRSQIEETKRRLQQEEEKAKEKYEKQFDLTSVAAEVAFNQQLYGVLVSKQQELKAQYIMQSKSPEIVEDALEPLYPSKPNRRITLAMGLFMGLFVGLGLVLLMEYMDSSIHTAGDVVRFIGLPILGRIPRLKRAEKNTGGDMLIAYNGANSPRGSWIREFYKESYRMFQLEMMAAVNEHGEGSDISGKKRARGLTLMVTSSAMEEGKSVVAANLAISISQTGKKVLLVDADCRRPIQHDLLELETVALGDGREAKAVEPRGSGGLSSPEASAPAGLVDILKGRVTWDEAVKRASIDNLFVVVSGQEYEQIDPSAILGASGMDNFISSSREEFDVVIFDSPPATLASESIAIGSKVDGVILVVRAGAAKKDAVFQTKEMLKNSGGNVLGIVLNFVSVRKRDYRYYYRR